MFIPSDNSTVIVDIGTETYKVGYSDKEYPTDYNSSMTFSNNFISPVQKSLIEDTDSYLALLSSRLPVDTSYLLVSENTFQEEGTKEKILENIMEEGKASSLLFSKSAILEAFSYGKSTALVISLSGGSSQIVSVIEGYIYYRKKVDYGCVDISKKFIRGNTTAINSSNKLNNSSYKMMEYGRSKKEDFYHTISDKEDHKFEYTHSPLLKILDSIQEVVENSPFDKKSTLLNNIIVTGGGSYISNISSIIEKAVYDKYSTENIVVSNTPSTFHCFFGGAIMGNIGSFKSLNIGRQDYMESGVGILKRKNQSWIINI